MSISHFASYGTEKNVSETGAPYMRNGSVQRSSYRPHHLLEEALVPHAGLRLLGDLRHRAHTDHRVLTASQSQFIIKANFPASVRYGTCVSTIL